jgi:hypothetical protein
MDSITMMDTTISYDVATKTTISDTLDTDAVPLPLRGENVLLIGRVRAQRLDGVTTYKSGFIMADLTTITCPNVRGMEMVRGSGTAPTIIEAQRDAWAVVVSHGNKTNERKSSGFTKGGHELTIIDYTRRMWVSHYVMSVGIDKNENYVATLVTYADVR